MSAAKREALQKLLVVNSTVTNKTYLKKRLIAAGLLKNKCVKCGIGPKWRGSPLTLEMDHINGDNTDNRLSNLRILCLNCHAQTSTFRRSKAFLAANTSLPQEDNCFYKFKRRSVHVAKRMALCVCITGITVGICTAIYYII